jgi:adenosylcobinamide amidohydrolase
MRLGTWYEGVELHRTGRLLYGRFLVPHRVLSTCQVRGGVREDLQVVVNRQVCEPAGHCERMGHDRPRDPLVEHADFCTEHGLDPQATAVLGTAANMRCAGVASESFRDLVVLAAATAGVEGNAGRAGDPATSFEWDGRYERLVPNAVPEAPGTINTMLFISHELTCGALTRALITATEAKTAVLQDLQVTSRYSQRRATGTGTDQLAVACRTGTGRPLTSAGLHGKLGELIGRAVGQAIREALVLQNGLTPDSRRSVVTQLGRFGITAQRCCERAREVLDEADALLFHQNFRGVDADPMVVAAAAALAEIVDQQRAGILPDSCASELFREYGARLGQAVAGSGTMVERLNAALEPLGTDLPEVITTALVVGFGQRWTGGSLPS